MKQSQTIADRLKWISERIAEATLKSGRKEGSVKLVAVSKTQSCGQIEEAFAAGQRDFGENYIAEAVSKIRTFREKKSEVFWHMIGHLQTNKVKLCFDGGAPLFGLIHSLDSLKVAREFEKASLGRPSKPEGLPVLAQVNLAGEASKGGFQEGELIEVLGRACAMDSIRLSGVMVIPPVTFTEKELHDFYERARRLHEKIKRELLLSPHFCELSMGMSNDFEIGIFEGATIVRIGSAIFGPRMAKE